MLNSMKFRLLILVITLQGIISCTYLQKTNEQTETLEQLGQISGFVITEEKTQSPIVIAILLNKENRIIVSEQKRIDHNGRYQFYLPSGQYSLIAYIDSNRNNQRDQGESSVLYTDGSRAGGEIFLADNQKKLLRPISIKLQDQEVNSISEVYTSNNVSSNVGKVISLSDAVFNDDNRKLGFWHPIDFVEKSVGGLMMLQAYEPNKTPVIFIHGILGSPTEFSAIIKQLDNTKFQPWVLFYPTGVPLTLISDYLVDSLNLLKEKYDFSNVHLISHSMGGLIARSFLMKSIASKQKFDVSLYVTVNSPLYGMDSAARGIKSSPIVIASWRDLATNSDFINSLHQWHLPQSIPYHLFFSYYGDENGDGVVPLRSQLSLSLQNEALRIYGSGASHSGILQDQDFIKRLNKVMLAPTK